MAAIEALAPDSDEAISPGQPVPAEAQKSRTRSRSPASVKNALGPLDLRADPDAQATVTDYLDFTEYLPSDMIRSLTLIGKLDQTYIDASIRVHELTTKWGQLPSLPPEERPNPVPLRAEVSENLNHALGSRVSAHAEAVRMAEIVNRHYNRAKTIHVKLQKLLENYPSAEELQKSPVAPRSPQLVRGTNQKVTLRLDNAGQRPRRQRPPRITVPGEVLAPYEVDYETYSDESESSSEEEDDSTPPRATPSFLPRVKGQRGRPPKLKLPRAPRRSSISTSFALSQLRKPPENAVVGSADAPWLQLTQYELAMLRKRMKKNAAWAPSDTMIARELRALGRGPEAYKAARKKAEDEGMSFDGTVPAPVLDSESGIEHLPPGALSYDSLTGDRSLSNRGMKLNEAKKMKRESLAKLAAEEAEESARKFRAVAQALLGGTSQAIQEQQSRSAMKLKLKKRKRDAAPEAEEERQDLLETPLQAAQRPSFKRTKTETPVPPPHLTPNHNSSHSQETPVPPPQLTPGGTVVVPHAATPVPLPMAGHDQSIVAAAKLGASSPESSTGAASGSTITTTVPVKPPADSRLTPAILSPRKSATPIMPPVRETRKRESKKDAARDSQAPSARASSRPVTPAGSTPGPEFQTVRRPASRGKAASQEPQQQQSIAADRPRRASTARNTPAPESRPASNYKRAKRPAPGVISRTNSGGSSAVGKRKAAPNKKKARALQRREKGGAGGEPGAAADGGEVEIEVEVDDEGNVIDPDEPKYCLCNRVSFGTMIQCDNIDNCKQEWFHLDCVGLKEIPARTTKWYCPECRKALNIGEKGEVSARGVKM